MARVKREITACHIAEVRKTYKGTTYTTTLLRRTYRKDGKVCHETLGNLTHLPVSALALVKRSLAGEQFVSLRESVEIERTLPHGHVAAGLDVLRRLGVDRLIHERPSRERDVVCALIVARVLETRPASTAPRCLWERVRNTTLSELLDLEPCTEEDVSGALCWLAQREQPVCEALVERLRAGGEPLRAVGYGAVPWALPDGEHNRTHVLIDLLAGYLEARMRTLLAPLLAEGQSLHAVLFDLATIVTGRVRTAAAAGPLTFQVISSPTERQERVLAMLGLRLAAASAAPEVKEPRAAL